MKRFLHSFIFAGSGLVHCLRREPNFKIHIAAAIVATALGFFFRLERAEWLVIIICMASVIAAEMFNTALEHLCNLVQREIHPSVKIIKDVAAGAVLVMAIMAAICGGIIFLPRIILFIQSI